MANIHTYTIGAYTPYYDRKQLADFSVVGGKNFMPTTEGYKSNFGSDVLTDRRIDKSYLENAQMFSLAESQLLLCTKYGVLSWDSTSEGWYFLIKSPVILSNDYPWSLAYVGGDWYLCKQGFGVYRYRQLDNSILKVTSNVPTNPVSICSSSGRLVILGESTYAWSAIGDGADLATSLETGAGFQSLSLAGGGKALAVKSLLSGFMVYTTSGIVKAEAIDTPNPYYHRLLTSSDYSPVSPWAICEIGVGSHLFMAKSGLFATSGNYPETFENEFSKWLTGTVLKYLLNSRYMVPIRLVYDNNNRWVFLSYGESSLQASPYSLAYVYDIALAKWGRFDQGHYFVDNVYIPSGIYEGYKLVCGTTDGAIRVLDKDFGISQLADDSHKNNYPVVEVPSYTELADEPESAIHVFCASCQIETYNFTSVGVAGNRLGMYVYDILYRTPMPDLSIPNGFEYSYGLVTTVNMMAVAEDIQIDMMSVDEFAVVDMLGEGLNNVFSAYAMAGSQLGIFAEYRTSGELANLDSVLETGLYHIADFEDLRQATVMTEFAQIHEETYGDSEFIDMQEVGDIDLDMELIDGEIDMGTGLLSSPNYQNTLVSSSDGYGHRDLHIYDIEPYSIVGNRFNYNCYSTGLYHGFRLATVNGGDYYHLKQVQVNIIQGGLIYDGRA